MSQDFIAFKKCERLTVVEKVVLNSHIEIARAHPSKILIIVRKTVNSTSLVYARQVWCTTNTSDPSAFSDVHSLSK